MTVIPTAAPDAAEVFEPAQIEDARRMFVGGIEFTHAANSIDALPPVGLTEIAFAGRSNVGKSSLVNALVNQSIARTSNTPGRTQEIIFFKLGESLTLVDLPGYGYAKVSKSKSAAWNTLIRTYLRGRPGLRRVCLLVDARHGLKPSDHDVMGLMDEAAVVYQIVLTKADKMSASELKSVLAALQVAMRPHTAAYPFVAITSARTGLGLPELRASLALLAGPA